MAILVDGVSATTSVNPSTSTVAGTTITLAPRLTVVEGASAVWQNVCVRLTGCNGLSSIVVKIPHANARRVWLPTYELGYWSYDGLTWVESNSVSQDGTYTYCTFNGPAASDTLWFARDRREGVVSITAWLDSMESQYPYFVRTLPGFDGTWTVDTFTAQTDELGRNVIGTTPLLACLFSCGSGYGKPRICLTSGVHAAEDLSRTILKRSIESLLAGYVAGTAAYRNLFNRFDFLFVHTNSPGIEGGHCRAQFETVGSDNDLNRHFTSGTFETVTKTKSLLTRELQPGSTAVLMDHHTQYWTSQVEADGQGLQGQYVGLGSSLESTWGSTYDNYVTYTDYALGFGPPAGTLIGWAISDRLVPLGQVIETNNNESKTDAAVLALGSYEMLAYNDLLVAGAFGTMGAAQTARQSALCRRAA